MKTYTAAWSVSVGHERLFLLESAEESLWIEFSGIGTPKLR